MRVLNYRVQIDMASTGSAVHFLDKPHRIRASHMKPVNFEQERISLLIELQKSLSKVISEEDCRKVLFLFSALYIKDRNTALHSLRVRDSALALAGKCKLTYEEKVAIKVGVPLHDIGKMGCPDSLFTNTGPLTAAQKSSIRNHPEYGELLIQKAKLGHIPGLIDVTGKHHERFDGSGYPYRIKGHSAPIVARLVAIADSLDAMMDTERGYKTPLSDEEAKQRIWELKHHFDREIAKELQSNLI